MTLGRRSVDTLAERFDELSLTDDPLDTSLAVECNHDATRDGQKAFGGFLEGILGSNGHVFIVQGEVGHGLSHGMATLVAGFG
ncbi:MAG: hypothetical protein ACPGWQ_01020, partial [Poseidonia sp.]